MSSNYNSEIISIGINDSELNAQIKTVLSSFDNLAYKLEKIETKINGMNLTPSFDKVNKNIEKINSSYETYAKQSISYSSSISNGLQKNLIPTLNTIESKFSLLGITGVKIASQISDSFIGVSKSMLTTMTGINNIIAGYDKWSEKAGSVRTMLNSIGDDEVTAGMKKVDYIEGQLQRLERYADETSYSYSELANVVSIFTSMGQDLDTAMDNILGLAGWNSFAGKATTQFYQLAHAMQTVASYGYLDLNRYKMIATWLTPKVKEDLIATAEELGTIKSGEVTLQNFSKNLTTDKWLTQDVFSKTFKKYASFANAVNEYMNVTPGVTASQAIKVLEQFYDKSAVDMYKSAQEAKNFSEAVSGAVEPIQTSWSKFFQNLFGNIEEATELFTGLSNRLYDIFAEDSGLKNEVMSYWANALGRDDFYSILIGEETEDGLERTGGLLEHIYNIVKSIKYGFWDTFGLLYEADPETGEMAVDTYTIAENLWDITHAIKEFVDSIAPSEGFLKAVQDISKSITTILKTLFEVLSPIAKIVVQLFGSTLSIGIRILGSLANLITTIINLINPVLIPALNLIAFTITDILNAATLLITFVMDNFSKLVSSIPTIAMQDASTILSEIYEHLKNIKDGIVQIFTGKIDLTAVTKTLSDTLGSIYNHLKNIKDKIVELFSGKIDLPTAIKNVTSSVSGLFGSLFNGNKNDANQTDNGLTLTANYDSGKNILDENYKNFQKLENLKNMANIICIGISIAISRLYWSIVKFPDISNTGIIGSLFKVLPKLTPLAALVYFAAPKITEGILSISGAFNNYKGTKGQEQISSDLISFSGTIQKTSDTFIGKLLTIANNIKNAVLMFGLTIAYLIGTNIFGLNIKFDTLTNSEFFKEFTKVGDIIKEKLSNILNPIKDFLNGILGIWGTDLNTIISNIKTTATTAIGNVYSFFKNLFSNGQTEEIKKSQSTMLMAFIPENKEKTFSEKFKEFVTNIENSIKSIDLGKIFQNIVNAIMYTLGAGIKTLSTLASTILSALHVSFNSIFEGIKSAIISFFTGLGVISKDGDVQSAINNNKTLQNVFGVVETIQNFLAILTENFGSLLPTLLFGGLLQTVLSNLSSMLDQVSSSFLLLYERYITAKETLAKIDEANKQYKAIGLFGIAAIIGSITLGVYAVAKAAQILTSLNTSKLEEVKKIANIILAIVGIVSVVQYVISIIAIVQNYKFGEIINFQKIAQVLEQLVKLAERMAILVAINFIIPESFSNSLSNMLLCIITIAGFIGILALIPKDNMSRVTDVLESVSKVLNAISLFAIAITITDFNPVKLVVSILKSVISIIGQIFTIIGNAIKSYVTHIQTLWQSKDALSMFKAALMVLIPVLAVLIPVIYIVVSKIKQAKAALLALNGPVTDVIDGEYRKVSSDDDKKKKEIIKAANGSSSSRTTLALSLDLQTSIALISIIKSLVNMAKGSSAVDVAVIVGIAATLGLIVFAASKLDKNLNKVTSMLKQIGKTFTLMRLALVSLSSSVKTLSKLNLKQLVKGLTPIIITLGGLFLTVLTAIKSSKIKDAKGIEKFNTSPMWALAANLALFIGAILVITNSIERLAKLDANSVAIAGGVLIGILGTIGFIIVSITALNNKKFEGAKDYAQLAAQTVAFGISLAALVVAIHFIVNELQELAKEDPEGVKAAGLAITEIVGTLGIIINAGALMGGLFGKAGGNAAQWSMIGMLAEGGALIVAVQSLAQIADVLAPLASCDPEGLTSAGLAISAIAGTLGIITNIGGFIGGIAGGVKNEAAVGAIGGMLAEGGALWVAVQGLQNIANALISLAVFDPESLDKAASVMEKIIGALGIITTIGGIIGGVSALAGPLGFLADLGMVAAGGGFALAALGIMEIGEAFKLLGEGLEAASNGLVTMTPSLIALDAIDLGKTALGLTELGAALTALAAGTILNAIAQLITMFAQDKFVAMAQNLDTLCTSMLKITPVFLLFKQSLESTFSDMNKKGVDTGVNYVAGLEQGLLKKDAVTKMLETAAGVATKIDKKVREVLDINSPSKVALIDGMYFVCGLENGITKYEYLPIEKAEELGIEIKEGTERELSEEEATKLAQFWTENLDTSLEEADMYGTGQNIGAQITQGIIDKFKDGDSMQALIDSISNVKLKERIQNMFNSGILKQMGVVDADGKILSMNSLLGIQSELKDNDSISDSRKQTQLSQLSEDDIKKKQEAIAKMQQTYASTEQEVAVVKADLASQATNLVDPDTNLQMFASNQEEAEAEFNYWIDKMAVDYMNAGEDYSQYLKDYEGYITDEEKLNVIRMQTYKNFSDTWKTQSGFSWDVSGQTSYTQSTASVTSVSKIKENQKSFMAAYQNFVKDIRKIAKTGVSNNFLRAVWSGGPNGSLYLSIQNMGQKDIEEYASNYDAMTDYQNADSQVFLDIMRESGRSNLSDERQKGTVKLAEQAGSKAMKAKSEGPGVELENEITYKVKTTHSVIIDDEDADKDENGNTVEDELTDATEGTNYDPAKLKTRIVNWIEENANSIDEPALAEIETELNEDHIGSALDKAMAQGFEYNDTTYLDSALSSSHELIENMFANSKSLQSMAKSISRNLSSTYTSFSTAELDAASAQALQEKVNEIKQLNPDIDNETLNEQLAEPGIADALKTRAEEIIKSNKYLDTANSVINTVNSQIISNTSGEENSAIQNLMDQPMKTVQDYLAYSAAAKDYLLSSIKTEGSVASTINDINNGLGITDTTDTTDTKSEETQLEKMRYNMYRYLLANSSGTAYSDYMHYSTTKNNVTLDRVIAMINDDILMKEQFDTNFTNLWNEMAVNEETLKAVKNATGQQQKGFWTNIAESVLSLFGLGKKEENTDKAATPSEITKAATPSEITKAATPSEIAKAATPSEITKAATQDTVNDTVKDITVASSSLIKKATNSTIDSENTDKDTIATVSDAKKEVTEEIIKASASNAKEAIKNNNELFAFTGTEITDKNGYNKEGLEKQKKMIEEAKIKMEAQNNTKTTNTAQESSDANTTLTQFMQGLVDTVITFNGTNEDSPWYKAASLIPQQMISGLTSETYEQLLAKALEVITATYNTTKNFIETGDGGQAPWFVLGQKIDNQLANGMYDKRSEVIKMASQVCQDAITAATITLGIDAEQSSQFYRIGEYMVDGLTLSIKAGESSVTTAIADTVIAMAAAAEEEAEIESPSKLFYGIGDYIVQGLANGVSENATLPVAALSDTIGAMADQIMDDQSYSPTITPVLDLTELSRQSGQINTLFANQQAMRISATMRDNQNGGNNGQSVVNNYNFTQNNTSPVALNDAEIYRQTYNQFNKFKERSTGR